MLAERGVEPFRRATYAQVYPYLAAGYARARASPRGTPRGEGESESRREKVYPYLAAGYAARTRTHTMP